LGEDVGVELPAWNRGHSATLRSDRGGARIAFQRGCGISEWLERVVASEDTQATKGLAGGGLNDQH